MRELGWRCMLRSARVQASDEPMRDGGEPLRRHLHVLLAHLQRLHQVRGCLLEIF